MNILLLTSHAIAEYDDLRMFADLGYPVYSIGGAYDEVPFEGKRPALPNVVRYPELEEATNRQRARLSELHGDPGPNIDWAKARLAPEVIDWADTIIVHHFPEAWIGGQWADIYRKRVIWRTCGQSDPNLESRMRPLRNSGMEVVRYSPREEHAFSKFDRWCGQDAVIRFGKYPEDYGPYDGTEVVVGNITQHMKQRGDACGHDRWERVTEGLPVMPAGPGSEVMRDGIGSLDYPEMLDYLRHIRAYLYTGTMPASYTLGLIEAMLSGMPVVPIRWQTDQQWLADLWEANDIVPLVRYLDPEATRALLRAMLDDYEFACFRGAECRDRARDLFGIDTVGAQWRAFLG